MNIRELRYLAKANGLRRYSNLRKKELVDFINSHGIDIPESESRARQYHGFEFEKVIISKFKLCKTSCYTDKFDAYTQDGIPVQIKYIKLGCSIDMGDLRRNMSMSTEFILYIGFWKTKRENLVELYRIVVPNFHDWNKLFFLSQYNAMKCEMSLITNLKIDDYRWKAFCLKYKQLWNSTSRITQIRFKRDHKSQKRVQCAINKTQFLKIRNQFQSKKIDF